MCVNSIITLKHVDYALVRVFGPECVPFFMIIIHMWGPHRDWQRQITGGLVWLIFQDHRFILWKLHKSYILITNWASLTNLVHDFWWNLVCTFIPGVPRFYLLHTKIHARGIWSIVSVWYSPRTLAQTYKNVYAYSFQGYRYAWDCWMLIPAAIPWNNSRTLT